MTVFCDNGDCCYIGEDGLCGCDKLSIVGGVCAGSCRSGRNACDGDVDERLNAENDKLRELCDDFYKCLDTALYLAKDAGYPVMPDQKLFDSLYPRMRELGIEV